MQVPSVAGPKNVYSPLFHLVLVRPINLGFGDLLRLVRCSSIAKGFDMVKAKVGHSRLKGVFWLGVDQQFPCPVKVVIADVECHEQRRLGSVVTTTTLPLKSADESGLLGDPSTTK